MRSEPVSIESVADDATRAEPSPESLYLRADYRRQAPKAEDPAGRFSLNPQWGVYEFASRYDCERVIDVGCGGAGKTRHFFDRRDVVLVDRPAMLELVEWDGVERHGVDLEVWSPDESLCKPDTLVICADVIECLWNPLNLLSALAALWVDGCVLLLSTPDRIAMTMAGYHGAKGPPRDQKQAQLWSIPEFHRLLASVGLGGHEVLRMPSRKGSSDRITQLWILERSARPSAAE